ncbi:MAG: VWA domain-containing protein, partial [Acidobacteriota bacterium]
MPRPSRFLSLLVGATLLVAAPAFSQDDQPIFDEVVEVNIVNVDVVVIDKDGEPVHGLGPEDFRINEDGDSMEITNFYEVRDGRNVAAPVAGQLIEAGLPDPEPVPNQKPAIDLESRAFVLFFDNSSLEKKNRKRVLQASRDFVRDSMGENDFVKVSYLSASGGLETLQGFTNSPGDVVYAIDRLEDTQVEGNVVNNNTRHLVRDLVRANISAETAGQALESVTLDTSRIRFQSNLYRAKITSEVQRAYMRSQQSLAGIEYLIRPLAGIPGQKAVIYAGEGLPTKPGESLWHAYYNKFSNISAFFQDELTITEPEIQALDYDLTRNFERMVAKAQEAGVRFYAIDAAGRRPNYRLSAEYGLADANSIAGTGQTDVWNQRVSFIRDRNLQGGLELIAHETGAAMIANTRSYGDFFDRIDRDLNNFYSLGYQPPRERDGLFHSVEVEPVNPDYRAIYRQSYQNKTAEQSLVDLALAELLTDASNNPLDIWIEPGKASPSDKQKYILPLQIKFPADKATLLPQGDSKVGQLTAVVVVKDEIGDTSPPQRIPLTVEIDAGQIAEGKVPVAVADLRLVMREGKQTVAVAVRDRLSGIASSKRRARERSAATAARC